MAQLTQKHFQVHNKFSCEVSITHKTSVSLSASIYLPLSHYSPAQSHKAQVKRDSVFKVICLCTPSVTVEEKETQKLDRSQGGAGGVPMMPLLTVVSRG